MNCFNGIMANQLNFFVVARILAMFDHEFRQEMQAGNVSVKMVEHDDRRDLQEIDVHVNFKPAEAVKEIFPNKNSHLYTVEISPAESFTHLSQVLLGVAKQNQKSPTMPGPQLKSVAIQDNASIKGDEFELSKIPAKEVVLEKLSKHYEYTIKVSTILNGHTIAQKIIPFDPMDI